MSVLFSRRAIVFIVLSFAVAYVILISESFHLLLFEPEVAVTAHSHTDLNDKNTLVMQTNLKSVLSFWSRFARGNKIYYIAHQGTAMTIFRDGKLPPWEDDADFFLPPSSMKRLRHVLSASHKLVKMFLGGQYGDSEGYLVEDRYFFTEPKVDIYGYWFKVFDLKFQHGKAGPPLCQIDLIDCSTPETLWCDSTGFLNDADNAYLRKPDNCKTFLTRTCSSPKFSIECLLDDIPFRCPNTSVSTEIVQTLYGKWWYERPYCFDTKRQTWIKRKTDSRGRKGNFNCT